tara:strand:- start:19037 stop:19999 length:963 start_codon:yes stop_codon:yes gene_type:complete
MENVYIFGSQGQDGQLLNELLNANHIDFNLILFTKNSVLFNNFEDVKEIKIENNYSYISLVNSLFVKFPPKIIFYFAAVHFSATEFKNQISDNDLNNMSFVNYFLPLHIFNYCNINEIAAKILFTSSALIFSNSEESPQSENTKRKPTCIYGNQKVLIEEYLMMINQKFNCDTYTAILYNHESFYRKEKFFTKKLISFCSNYRFNTSKSKLQLFNRNLSIDMGYAPEYVNAMYKLITNGKPGSYIFSTQKLIKIEEFVRGVLEFYKLDEDIIKFNDLEPRNSTQLLGLNKKLFDEIGWVPNFTGKKLIMQLCEDFEKHKY